MQDYRNLKVWEKAHQLALEIYRETDGFPSRERFGLIAQIRRSCASIPTNIAEGCGRGTAGQLRFFLRVSLGSANELEYQLILSLDLGYLGSERHKVLSERIAEVRRMLCGLVSRVGG